MSDYADTGGAGPETDPWIWLQGCRGFLFHFEEFLINLMRADELAPQTRGNLGVRESTLFFQRQHGLCQVGWVLKALVAGFCPHPSEPDSPYLSEADLAPLSSQMVPQGGPSGSAYENV